MNRFKTLLIAAAVVTGSSALASALPNDHDGRGYDRAEYRGGDDHDRGWHNGWYRWHRDRDDRRYFRDRDDYRFRDRDDYRYFRGDYDRRYFDRDDNRYFVGERRWFNGYYWTWDGERWCRRRGGVNIYLSF
jgi:hypothetical protein